MTAVSSCAVAGSARARATQPGRRCSSASDVQRLRLLRSSNAFGMTPDAILRFDELNEVLAKPPDGNLSASRACRS